MVHHSTSDHLRGWRRGAASRLA